MKRSLLFSAVLCAASLTSVHAAQPITEPEFASDIVDRYADHIFYGSGATGMALVVIDGNQRVFRSYGETRPGNNVRPQLDSVVRIASLTKLMTSEMLVKLLDQGTVKLNDPLSKYAPPGARVPTYNGTPLRWSIWQPIPARCPVNSPVARHIVRCLSGQRASNAGNTFLRRS